MSHVVTVRAWDPAVPGGRSEEGWEEKGPEGKHPCQQHLGRKEGGRRRDEGGAGAKTCDSWSKRLLPTCRAHTAAVRGRMLCLVSEK